MATQKGRSVPHARKHAAKAKRPTQKKSSRAGLQGALDVIPNFMHYGITRRWKIEALEDDIKATLAEIREARREDRREHEAFDPPGSRYKMTGNTLRYIGTRQRRLAELRAQLREAKSKR